MGNWTAKYLNNEPESHLRGKDEVKQNKYKDTKYSGLIVNILYLHAW